MAIKKTDILRQALDTLKEALEQERNSFVRDSIIQRFEYSVELFWKSLKEYLYEKEGVEVLSPNNTMRECRNVGLFIEEDVDYSIQMIKDRNLSSHAYNEDLAEEIVSRVTDYTKFMERFYEKLIKKY